MDCESWSWYVLFWQCALDMLIPPGITPFVKPDDLRFYFEEIVKYSSEMSQSSSKPRITDSVSGKAETDDEPKGAEDWTAA